MKRFLVFLLLFAFSGSLLLSQIRIAVLPFQNMDGKLQYNIYCYKLQDSVFKLLMEKDPSSQFYHIVPQDSIDMMVAEYNLNPNNPQYPTDLWKVVKNFNVEKVVMGNFNIQAERFLINAYVYDIRTKLSNPQHQAKDIFKQETNIMESVPIIVRKLLPALGVK